MLRMSAGREAADKMSPTPNKNPSTFALNNFVKHQKDIIILPNGSKIILNPADKAINKIITNRLSAQCGTSERIDHVGSTYSNRLKTYEVGWRLDFITPRQMALAGFYFTGKQDRVKCMYCSIELDYWCPGDIPMDEHKRKSPNCQFFNEFEGYDVCGLYGDASAPYSMDTANSMEIEKYLYQIGAVYKIKIPNFKEYASYESRLKSFDICQLTLTVDKYSYSEAGFFYLGNGENDYMLCFNCGQGLRDWYGNDEPWIEHAKWSPSCSFLLLSKGQPFVRKCFFDEHEAQKKNQVESSSSAADQSTASVLESALAVESMINKIERLEINENNQVTTSNVDLYLPQQNTIAIPDSNLCKICMKEEMNVAFMPCGHIIACIECTLSLDDCAVCRRPFNMAMKIHLYQDEPIDEGIDQLPCCSSQSSVKSKDMLLCKICNETEREVVFIPCGHVYACFNCSKQIHDCPVCSEIFCASMQIYL